VSPKHAFINSAIQVVMGIPPGIVSALADQRSELRGDLINIIIGSLLFALGCAALALSAFRQKIKDRPVFYFGIFCGLYGLRQLGNTGLIQTSVVLSPLFWSYLDAFITYFIPLPIILFVEQIIGPGWKSSIRRTRQIQMLYTFSAIMIDSLFGPRVAIGPNGFLVILGLAVITANGLLLIRRKDAPIGREMRPVLVGALILVLMAVNTNLVDKQLVPWRLSLEPLGMLVFVICLGYVIAQRYFTKERELLAISYELRESALRAAAAEAQARAIESENQRRAQELEEARQLQLSMLPRSAPQLPHLEIAAYMKPATEVGGDYYDFHLAADGILTVAIGDATGHGLKAGTIVTATKSLFEAFAQQPDITHIFQQASHALKRMNLRSLFMAMAIIKIDHHRVLVSSAGMPPVLIYHAANRTVEEIAVRGMPLGSVMNYPYKQQEVTISAGDVVVLMSDGLPERFNGRGEMLGYTRGSEILKEVAEQSPEEIINHFVRAAEAWAEGRPQDDDVTFVVLKRT
jgi:serine phosphatase RsbU (regulator of sigma subunit)